MVVVEFLIYLFKSFRKGIEGMGSGNWMRAEATVTADPLRGDHAVEIPYSYRLQGELYTGLHEEPIFLGSEAEYVGRFPKGRKFVVRVKPGRPEVSVVYENDQNDGVQRLLERSDEERKRKSADLRS